MPLLVYLFQGSVLMGLGLYFLDININMRYLNAQGVSSLNTISAIYLYQ